MVPQQLSEKRTIHNTLFLGTWIAFGFTAAVVVSLGCLDTVLFYCVIHLAIATSPCIIYLRCYGRGIRESAKANKKHRQFSKVCMIISIAVLIIGAPIALGIHFGIFFPLKVQEWEPATCTVTDHNDELEPSPIGLLVYVHGYELLGCGCASVHMRDTPADRSPGFYPYSYGSDDLDRIRLPTWHCSCPEKDYCPQKGDTFECLVRADGGSFNDLSKRTQPKCQASIHDDSYLEVIWREDAPYYDKSSETANIVCSFFLFIVGFYGTVKFTFQYISLRFTKRRY
mmetsp:Transcript_51172/g.58673  ORF Transcript_51172/g.58673 Transcript_51172/m.58673 type:complete len:284 (+) Transcript_51172:36-887(+)